MKDIRNFNDHFYDFSQKFIRLSHVIRRFSFVFKANLHWSEITSDITFWSRNISMKAVSKIDLN